MYFYRSSSNNPYFNLATEEYFLRNFSEDFFMLYQNRPTVVVGKHQNTVAEINAPYLFENDIWVARRLSGGGAVYHDQGNLNYGFIQTGTEGNLVNFARFSRPVIDLLNQLKVPAELIGKSDLKINGLKFSGNAEHVFKNRVLHHGTMLFDSNLKVLDEAIWNDWTKFSDKGVRSNRSHVTNILPHLQHEMDINEFALQLSKFVAENEESAEEYSLTETDLVAINDLVISKYATEEWIYGYSPRYVFEKKYNGNDILLEVEKGIILTLKYNGNEYNKELTKILPGEKHQFPHLKRLLTEKISAQANELLTLLF